MEVAMDTITHISAFTMRLKTILIIGILLAIVTSCGSAIRFVSNNSTCGFNEGFFEIKSKDLTLDIDKYESSLSKRGVQYLEKNKRSYTTKLSVLSSKNIVLDVIDDKRGILKSLRYDSIGKIKDISFIYKNGNILMFEEMIYKDGKVYHVTNHEKGYTICWTEAISILKRIARKEIKKNKIDTFFLNRVNINEFPNSRPRWIVSMKGQVEGDYVNKRYVIDGVTGELIRTYRVNKIYESIKE